MCPDYWKLVGDEKNKHICEATKEAIEYNYPLDEDKSKCKVNDSKVCFNKKSGNNDECVSHKRRKNWAMNCKVTWDGITNSSLKEDSLNNIGRSFFSLF